MTITSSQCMATSRYFIELPRHQTLAMVYIITEYFADTYQFMVSACNYRISLRCCRSVIFLPHSRLSTQLTSQAQSDNSRIYFILQVFDGIIEIAVNKGIYIFLASRFILYFVKRIVRSCRYAIQQDIVVSRNQPEVRPSTNYTGFRNDSLTGFSLHTNTGCGINNGGSTINHLIGTVPHLSRHSICTHIGTIHFRFIPRTHHSQVGSTIKPVSSACIRIIKTEKAAREAI